MMNKSYSRFLHSLELFLIFVHVVTCNKWCKNLRVVTSSDNLGTIQTIKPAVSRFRPGN